MKHLSEMIEDANHAVTNIEITHGASLMELMKRPDFTHEQKMAVIALFAPVIESVKLAQSKFSFDV